jgi:co-chaperonin GroES (HSP10)
MSIRPLHDRIIVQRVEASTQSGRIIASIASPLLTTEAVVSHMSHDDALPAQSAGGAFGGF